MTVSRSESEQESDKTSKRLDDLLIAGEFSRKKTSELRVARNKLADDRIAKLLDSFERSATDASNSMAPIIKLLNGPEAGRINANSIENMGEELKQLDNRVEADVPAINRRVEDLLVGIPNSTSE